VVTGADVIRVVYHQFGVTDLAVGPLPTPRVFSGPTGLVEPAVGGALVYTGIARGPVHLSVRVLPEAPASVDDSWEEIAEVSLEIAPPAQHNDGEAFLLRRARERGRDPEPRGFRIATVNFDHDPQAFPLLNPDGGPCRLRVHARGRGVNDDGVDWEPREVYLLLAWPAPVSAKVVHKTASGATP